MKKLTTRKLCSMAVIACGTLFFGSCADHYDGDESWHSPVTNAALESPKSITIETSADGSQMTISWPVVFGAGGYEFKLINVNDPENPIVSDTLDKCRRTVTREEDMNYRVVVRALGNSQLNNTEAQAPKDTLFSTFTKTFAEIPEGDIYAYFQANPIPADSTIELNYDLKSGGNYTLSKPLDTNYHKVVIRTADKNNHAHITLSDSANFVISNSFTLKYVDIDASASTRPFMEAYKFETETAPEGILEKPGNYYLIEFVRILSSSITGVQGSLFYDNNKSYAAINFIIKESVIEMTTTTGAIKNEAFISFQNGGVKDFSCVNSTIFQTGEANSKYFLRYNNSIRVDRLGYDRNVDHTTLTYTNCTFYKVANGQWANYSGINNYTIYNLQNNIWYECADGQIARRMKGNGRLGNSCSWTSANNTYWYNGAKADQSDHDPSTSQLATDPAFEDADNADFTPTGAEQVALKTGDPRWYAE